MMRLPPEPHVRAARPQSAGAHELLRAGWPLRTTCAHLAARLAHLECLARHEHGPNSGKAHGSKSGKQEPKASLADAPTLVPREGEVDLNPNL